MIAYVKKVKKYWEQRYGAKIIILKPETTFEDWVFGVIEDKKAFHYQKVRGLPKVTEPCFWRREAKVKPFQKWIKENISGDYRVYIGYTTDEKHRMQKDKTLLYPLIYDYAMSEMACGNYLKEREMENPLYNHFTRTGCAICPYQSEESLYKVYKYYPNWWEYMKKIEEKLLNMKNVKNPLWKPDKSLKKYEEKFRKKDMQPYLFDFNDEPLRDCFCKI